MPFNGFPGKNGLNYVTLGKVKYDLCQCLAKFEGICQLSNNLRSLSIGLSISSNSESDFSTPVYLSNVSNSFLLNLPSLSLSNKLNVSLISENEELTSYYSYARPA